MENVDMSQTDLFLFCFIFFNKKRLFAWNKLEKSTKNTWKWYSCSNPDSSVMYLDSFCLLFCCDLILFIFSVVKSSFLIPIRRKGFFFSLKAQLYGKCTKNAIEKRLTSFDYKTTHGGLVISYARECGISSTILFWLKKNENEPYFRFKIAYFENCQCSNNAFDKSYYVVFKEHIFPLSKGNLLILYSYIK